MFKLSIIVPAAGTQEQIDETLLGVLENRPPHCEIVMPHSPGYVDPYNLEDEVRFVGVNSTNLATLINQGVAASQAPVLHTVFAARATPNWTEHPVDHLMAHPNLAAVSPLIVTPERAARIVAAGVCCCRSGKRQLVGAGQRCREQQSFSVDGPTLRAAFWNRQSFLTLGGYRDCFGTDLMDADLAARLRLAGMNCEVVSDSRMLGEPLPQPRRSYQNARQAEQFYRTLADSELPTSGILHAAHIAWEMMRQLPSPRVLVTFAGRLRGWVAGGIDETPAPIADVQASSDEDLISLPFQRRQAANDRPDSDGHHYAKSA